MSDVGDANAAAAELFGRLADNLHRLAQDEQHLHQFVRTGRPGLDALVDRALESPRELSERGIEAAACAAAAFTAKIFEEET